MKNPWKNQPYLHSNLPKWHVSGVDSKLGHRTNTDHVRCASCSWGLRRPTSNLDLLPFKLKTGPPVTPVLENLQTNCVLYVPYNFE